MKADYSSHTYQCWILEVDHFSYRNQSLRPRCRPPVPCGSWPPSARAGMRVGCFEGGPAAHSPHPGTLAADHAAPAQSLNGKCDTALGEITKECERVEETSSQPFLDLI